MNSCNQIARIHLNGMKKRLKLRKSASMPLITTHTLNGWMNEWILLMPAIECVYKKGWCQKKKLNCVLYKIAHSAETIKFIYVFKWRFDVFQALAWPSPLPPCTHTTSHTLLFLYVLVFACASVEHTCSYDKIAVCVYIKWKRGESRRKGESVNWEAGIASFEYFSNLCPHALSLKDAYVRVFFFIFSSSQLLLMWCYCCFCCCYLCFVLVFSPLVAQICVLRFLHSLSLSHITTL